MLSRPSGLWPSAGARWSRARKRHTLILAFCVSLVVSAAGASPARAEAVFIGFDRTSPQASYAARQLSGALVRRGATIVVSGRTSTFRIMLGVSSRALGPEAFSLISRRGTLSISGGDARGLIYGSLAAIEQLESGRPLRLLRDARDRPALRFRAIKFDLPWESYRASAALDQHFGTVRDLKFWAAFFDMMARNRFNAITLSNLDPWPYMVRTKGFPEASRFDDRQLAEWQQFHRAIFRMAKERGIDTYLLPFNIFVSKEFAAAHNLRQANSYPYYNAKGNTSPLIKAYVHDSIAQVLAEYPDLTGLGINLGEGMGGMTTAERIAWVNDTYLAAIREAKRPVKLLWNLSSVDTKEYKRTTADPKDDERMLRAAIERIDYVDGPIEVGLKFNWSHALSTPTLVQIHGGKVGDTYFSPPPRNYQIEWIARNEDVFALRWGVPSFVRRHVLTNGTASYVGGYTVGSETYLPALDYFSAPRRHPQWTYAFERQWLYYMLWGRLLYDPKTPDTVFSDEFTRRYGAKGRHLLRAYELASATPLRLASLFYSQWDHTLYSEGMLWLDGRSMAYLGVEALIRQPVLDPAYVSVADFVAATNKGLTFPVDRMTPPKLASRLEADCTEALKLVAAIDPGQNLALRYELSDIRTWAHMGLHLAAKIRGAVALQAFRLGGDPREKQQAIGYLEKALDEWRKVSAITSPLYKPMLLTHFTGQSSALNPDAEFHWERMIPQVANDVAIARAAKPGPDAR